MNIARKLSFKNSDTHCFASERYVEFMIFGIALFLLLVGVMLLLMVEVNALIKTVRLGRWDWFVCLLLFSTIALPIYLFTEPETPQTTLPS